MSMRTLEAAVLRGARVVLKNSKLRQKDILAWSTGNVEPTDGTDEIVFRVPDPGVNVCVDKQHDKRKA